MALGLAACGGDATTPTAAAEPASSSPSPSAVSGLAATDLAAIGCATVDPGGVGERTGAWQGNDSGVYYIRQVGDCVWWFGTEVDEIEPGRTNQRGFANVASGRIVGTQIDLEWADVPLGDTVNGGGLTFVYDEASDRLTLTEQRGGNQRFGGSILTRIDPSASPSASATP
jgi:hypothetical protein